jgi:hypothetical protein
MARELPPGYSEAQDMSGRELPPGYSMAEPMRDAVADNPDFGVSTRTQTARQEAPPYIPMGMGSAPNIDISPTRALLTNEPTSGLAEDFIRGIPAGIGGSFGGAAGGGVTAGLAAVPGAAAGAAAGEGTRQALAQSYAALTGKEFTPPQEVIGRTVTQGILGAAGQMGAAGLQRAGTWASGRIPDFIETYFGPNAALTRYIRGRGANKVLTPGNMNPDAPMNALEGVQRKLSGARKAAGGAVGAAEDAILESGGLGQQIDLTDIADDLEAQITKHGFDGPGASLAGKDAKTLKDVLGHMRKGNLSAAEAINLKRRLGETLSYSGGRVPEINKTAEGILKKTTGKIAERINTTFPDLGKANANFSKIAQLYDKYRKYLGGTGEIGQEILSDANALRRIRASMIADPRIPKSAVAEFDAAVKGSGEAVQTLFDTVAANAFNAEKVGRGAPSNILLKGASTIGLTSPYMAGQVLRGAEAAAKVDPAGVAFRLAPAAGNTLFDYYQKQGAR